ncbi:MAG: sensor domain-containing diguanylate cyclase, partial [Pseudomonadales bacterium]|nr:sensor domain-containing diguanylate cyclase [Pseudomonadales bacterium]
KSTLNLGFSQQTLWVKVSIDTVLIRAPGLIEIGWPFLDQIEGFWVADGKIHTLGLQGDRYQNINEYLNHRFWVFPLPGNGELKGDLFLKIKTSSAIILPIFLWGPQSFYEKESTHLLFTGFTFGVLAIILVYNLGMWFYIRNKTYIYYVGYVVFVCSYMASLTGVGQQYLWGNLTFFNDNMLLIAVMGSFVFGSLFVDAFLELAKNNRLAHRVVMGIIAIYLGFIVIRLLTSEAFITPIGQAFGIVVSLLAYGLGMYEWRKGNTDARYFTIAWSLLLLGTCTYTLLLAGWLPNNLFTNYVQVAGIGLEMALLSFALGERFTRERAAAKQATEVALHLAREVNRSHEAQIKLQENTNLRLEGLVKNRTEELENALVNLATANKRLEELSMTDQLTGLKNRRFFDEHFQEEYKRSIREQSSLSVVVLDIDHFKKVNDSYGHVAGDICLQRVAEVLQVHTQRPGDIAVRFGGEEFVILLANTEQIGAQQVCENIRDEVAQLEVSGDGHQFRVTISLGIATMVPNEEMAPASLLKKADAALYRAKSLGRNRVAISA